MPYTAEEMDSWPDQSYAGRERRLADMLDDDTLEWYNAMKEYGYDTDEFGTDPTAWHLFNLLMMHRPAFFAMTGHCNISLARRLTLRRDIQDDANENSSDYFQARLEQRYQAWLKK